MAKARPQKTLSDYVAIAVSPALIMVLVGSLVFFLQEVGYSGEFAGRLKWILFWFVFAAVLIARIGIEEGKEHAAVYTLAFWGAIALVVFRFVDQVLVGFGLLGVTWWCAKKLTWDCTLIDDSQDASGQGLLQLSGLESGDEDSDREPGNRVAEQISGESTGSEEKGEESADKPKDSKSHRPHAPGLWVVYFSLAALPLFGLGQLFIPAAEEARRVSAFQYLWFYVAAALGLLLTTSFLGLRRYLRQRKLTMPAAMTGRWIATGAILALGILIVCLLLPRPQATYSVTNLVDTVSEKVGEASHYAFGSDDAGEGEGRRVGREAEDGESQADGEGQKGSQGKQAGKTSKTGQQASGGKGKKEGSSQSKGGKQSQGKQDQNQKNGPSQSSSDRQNSKDEQGQTTENQNDEGQSDGSGDSESSDQNGNSDAPSDSSSAPNRIGETIAKLVKWFIYIAVAVVAVIYAIRHWSTLMARLSRIWQDLRELFAGWFGGKPKPKTAADSGSDSRNRERPIRPFADYSNPFRSGMERDMGTIELIEYTYDALQAWGAEQGFPKRPDQTPTEYVQELSRQTPKLSGEARQVANLYLQAAFSTSPPGLQSHKQLKKAWSRMESSTTLSG